MTLNQFIKQALERVMRDGWTPEIIAILANEYRQLVERKVFTRSPQQFIEPYLTTLFKKEVESGKILDRNKGIDKFTFERIKPQFKQLLENRIKSNINLIKLERSNSIDVSTARFSGWLMSFDGTQEKLPPAKELPAFQNITKPMMQQKDYEHRLRAIDQGHKMLRAIDSVVAEQGGAIAGVWNAHQKTAYYDARPEHTKRDGVVYIRRDSWAVEQGLIKKGDEPWLESIEDPPALLINCTCFWSNIYTLPALYRIAPDRFTKKGLELLGK